MPILSLASMTGQGGVLAGKEAGSRYRRASRRPPSPMRLGAASETRRFQEPEFFDQQAMNDAQYTGPGELSPIILDVGGGNGNPGQIGGGLANAPRIGDPMDLMPPGVEQAGKPAFGRGKFGQFLGDNSDAFLGFASGALGSNQPGAFGRGFAGFQAGSQMDAERRDRAARVKALDEAFASLEAEGKMTPAHRALAAQYPEIGAKYAFEMMAPQGRDLINAGEGRLYDPNNSQWITAPDAGSGGALFDGNSVEGQALNQLVQRGILTPEQALDVAAGKTITDPSTGAILFASPQALTGQQGGGVPLTGPRAPTEGQANANLYASRMEAAEPIIEQFGAAGLSLKDQTLSRLPVIGNMMVSNEFQQLDQAQRDFINATLRRESGAVISPEEFDNARRQYFPQPGDNPDTLARKRESRRIAREQIRAAAGPAFPPQGESPSSADAGWTEIEPGVRMREVP